MLTMPSAIFAKLAGGPVYFFRSTKRAIPCGFAIYPQNVRLSLEVCGIHTG
jgi:hypothetical protein